MSRAYANIVGAIGFTAIMIVLPLVMHERYFLGVLTVGLIYGIWAAS